MKILYLAHRIPYPPNKGDKIRSFHEIRVLSKNHEIHLACLADDPADLRYRAELQSYCKRVAAVSLHKSRAKLRGLTSLLCGRSISTGYFHSRSLQQIVNDWLEGECYDAVIGFSSPMAEYLFRSPALRNRGHRKFAMSPTYSTSAFQSIDSRSPVLLMDFCDVDSDKWAQYARESRFLTRFIYHLESRRLLNYEILVNRTFDHSIFVSQPERMLFQSLFPSARHVHTISNGVDYDYFSPAFAGPNDAEQLNRENGPMLLFTGAMDYHANVDGVSWFANEVFPTIRSRHPDSVFYVVGSKPVSQVRELARRPGIHVTGYVEDVRPYYLQADVCVIPLRLARGVQNKVLEALSMAKPVVATSRANEGIGAISEKHLVIQDSTLGFQEAILAILRSRSKGESLGRNGREFICAKYDWNQNMIRFENLLSYREDIQTC